MNRRWAAGAVLLFLGVSLISWAGFSFPERLAVPILSPLPLLQSPINRQQLRVKNQKVIFGFLPYWNLKYEPFIRYGKLTHMAFFGFEVAPDGSIKTHTDDGFEEPGWTAYNSSTFGSMVRKAHDQGAKMVLVLRAFDNETIESVLLNLKRQERLVDETLAVVELKNLDGVNLDFEYVGSPPPSVRRRFTELVRLFRSACQGLPAGCHLSVDTYADAAEEDRLWDLEALEQEVDHLVVMAYDFTRPSSDYSGPVAPLHLIREALAAYAKQITLEKILLGVAYYGYEWPTYSAEPISKTADSGYIATYKRIKELVLGSKLEPEWDEVSFTPYLISTESGRTTQVFFDDTRSLGLKYDLVNEAGLSGVAIWALGYDGENPELWNLLEEKFF